MFIIAGLGNPGGQYAFNRHNIGFMAVDAIQARNGFSPWSKKFKAEVSQGTLAGETVLLIKPQTYMNLSGDSVGEAMRFYKLTASDLLVIYDELDLAPGKTRIKAGGGSGGHNGIKSLDAHCGKDYRRLRLGIGHPGAKELVTGHVLGDFSKADQQWLSPLLDAIGDHAAMLVRGEDSQFMNKLALASGGDDKPEKPAKADRPVPSSTAASAPSPAPSPSSASKGKSHVHQARKPDTKLPASGPMAEMLKRMFERKGDS